MPINKQSRIKIKEEALRLGAHIEDAELGEPWQNYTGTVKNDHALIIDVDNLTQLEELIKFIAIENSMEELNNEINFQYVDGYADTGKIDLDCTGCCPSFPFLSRIGNFVQKHNPLEREWKYNESFNYDQSRRGDDILFRFSKKYIAGGVYVPPSSPDAPTSEGDAAVDIEDKSHMDRIKALPRSRVVINAGVPFKDVLEKLKYKKKSMTSAPANIFMSPVQAALNGDCGTGYNEPSISGMVKKIHGINHLGERVTYQEGDEHFEAIRGGKADFFMVPTSMEFEVVDKFRLKEEKKSFKTRDAFLANIGTMLTQNQYFTASYIPNYNVKGAPQIIPNWQVRLWNYTTESKTKSKETSPVEMILENVSHDVIADTKGEIQALLFSKELHHLIPAYMKLIATLTDVIRGNKDVIATSNDIFQYKKAQSDDVIRETFFVPVKNGQESQLMTQIASFIDSTCDEMGEGNAVMGLEPNYPITYCVNYRFLKGTNGGLSTTHTKDDEHILAVELVTHKEAPGFHLFEDAFIQFLNENQTEFRFALNQTVPRTVKGFLDYLGGESQGLDAFKAALVEKFGPLEGIGTSPFVSDFDIKMLNNDAGGIIPRPELEVPEHSSGEITRYLKYMLYTLKPIVSHYLKGQDELQIAWGEFQRVAHTAINLYEKKKAEETTVELPGQALDERKDNVVSFQ